MQTLLYDSLEPTKIKGFAKFKQAIEADNFAQAEVKKIGDNLYRARLNQRDRLLFALYRYQGVQYCLVLEYLSNHAYEKSRFLAGAVIDEQKIPLAALPTADEAPELIYLNPEHDRFQLLDKVLSFDNAQLEVFRTPAPVAIIGSAGSGKTALMLEKMKQAVGDVLYVSHSPYLVQNAHQLYYANGYQNSLQEQVDFLSFRELLETIALPPGREASRRDFEHWHSRQRVKARELKDPQPVFEEFRGVLTGPTVDAPYLSRADYLALGIRQALFADELRDTVYDLFEKYLEYLKAQQLYDSNIISQHYLQRAEKRYDFVVIDEVQDITNIQLLLILKTLREPGQFMLCGDANQIVHSNFFSWSKLKSLFFEQQGLAAERNVLQILHANYRNSPLITAVANRILKLKVARFGSVDKESNYLVQSVGASEGRLQLQPQTPEVLSKLDASSRRSTKFAVVVLHPEQKAQARQFFKTPLVFSIQEAKGLEYENIILFNIISCEEKAYREIARGVDPAALEVDQLDYSRAKSKSDKSLEIYKFYINALYVAMTRAVQGLYIVEQALDHPLLSLLDLERFTGELEIAQQQSSAEEWQQEARRLELQGKQEQADAIRSEILSEKPVPWQPITREGYAELKQKVFDAGEKKQRLLLMEYAVLHQDREALIRLVRETKFNGAVQAYCADGFKPAALKKAYKSHLFVYDLKHANGVMREVEKYGVEHRTRFNMTPLMQAALIGNRDAVQRIAERGADLTAVNNQGLNAWQIALSRGFSDVKFARQLGELHAHLAADSISIQVDGKLIKLDERSMYGFLLNVFISVFHSHISKMAAHQYGGLTASDLAERLQCLPDTVLPPMKKKRDYISRYLSQNEVERDAPYNKKLFLRRKRGHYTLNPALQLRIGEQWYAIGELLDLGGGFTLPEYMLDTQDDPTFNHWSRVMQDNLAQFRQLYVS